MNIYHEDEIDVGGFNRANRIVRPFPLHPDVLPEIDNIDSIRYLLAVRNNLFEDTASSKRVLKTTNLDGLVQHWKSVGFKRIVTMAGPAISKISQVPDYSTRHSQLCKNLVNNHRLPSRSALFELDHILHKPDAFYELVAAIFPGNFTPNVYHYFIRTLCEQGILLRHYTQNIDMLERIVDIPDELLVEAHGTLFSNHCVHCRKEHLLTWMWQQLVSGIVPQCTNCQSLVLPDLVFVNQSLPARFYHLSEEDVLNCDLLIVMGTTLDTEPFGKIFERVNDRCVRLLIVDNDTDVSHIKGWQEGRINRRRDVLWRHDPDDAIWALAQKVGLLDKLEEQIFRWTKQSPSISRSSHSIAERTKSHLQ